MLSAEDNKMYETLKNNLSERSKKVFLFVKKPSQDTRREVMSMSPERNTVYGRTKINKTSKRTSRLK